MDKWLIRAPNIHDTQEQGVSVTQRQGQIHRPAHVHDSRKALSLAKRKRSHAYNAAREIIVGEQEKPSRVSVCKVLQRLCASSTHEPHAKLSRKSSSTHTLEITTDTPSSTDIGDSAGKRSVEEEQCAPRIESAKVVMRLLEAACAALPPAPMLSNLDAFVFAKSTRDTSMQFAPKLRSHLTLHLPSFIANSKQRAALLTSRLTVSPLRFSNCSPAASLRSGRKGVTFLSVDPLGSLCACGSRDGSIRIYDLDEFIQRESLTINGHVAPADVQPVVALETGRDVACVIWNSFSTDAEIIACCFSYAVDVHLYNLRSWDNTPLTILRDASARGGNSSIAFYDDQRIIAGGTQGQLRLWDVSLAARPIWCVSAAGSQPSLVSVMHLHGTLVASFCRSGVLHVWDTSRMTKPAFGTRAVPVCVLRSNLQEFINDENILVIGLGPIIGVLQQPDRPHVVMVSFESHAHVLVDLQRRVVLFRHIPSKPAVVLQISDPFIGLPTHTVPCTAASLSLGKKTSTWAVASALEMGVDILNWSVPSDSAKQPNHETLLSFTKSESCGLTMPGSVAFAQIGCSTIRTTHDLRRFLCAHHMSAHLKSRTNRVWLCGSEYSVVDVEEKSITLHRPYSGQPVIDCNPRLCIVAALEACHVKPDSLSTTCVTRTIATSRTVTALTAHPYAPYILVGLDNDQLIILSPLCSRNA